MGKKRKSYDQASHSHNQHPSHSPTHHYPQQQQQQQQHHPHQQQHHYQHQGNVPKKHRTDYHSSSSNHSHKPSTDSHNRKHSASSSHHHHHHHHHHQHPPPNHPVADPHTSPAPSAPSSRARTILALQAQISYELLSDTDLAREYVSLAGADISNGALSLARNLRSHQNTLLSTLYTPPPSAPSAPSLSSSSRSASPDASSSWPPPSSIAGPSPWSTMTLPSLKAYLDGPTHPLPALPPCVDADLERKAFIHRSTLPEAIMHSTVDQDYERLEFVGDVWIQLAATRLLYARYPDVPVGRLAHLRENLVKNETLAEFSLLYNFDERATLPVQFTSEKSRGHDRSANFTKVLGDMFEAFVAAVILADQRNGFYAVEEWLGALWRRKLPSKQDVAVVDTLAKAELARKVMGKGIKLEYFDIGKPVTRKDEPGRTFFKVGVRIYGWGWDGVELGTGEDTGKQDAGMRAAMMALKNPLTGQIAAVKREYDSLVKKEREREGGPDEGILKELDRIWKEQSKDDTKVERLKEKILKEAEEHGKLTLGGMQAAVT